MRIKLNANKGIVDAIRARLKITGGYCPCVPETEWNEDTKCICKGFLEQKEVGLCHCQLYEKVEE